MDKKYAIVLIIAAAMLMYIGTTMFNSTGLAITDLKVEEKDNNQYQIDYILRSVRSFDYLDCECILLDDKGQEIGRTNFIFNNLTDGSFVVNNTINTTQKAKEVQISIYTEKFNPELKNGDGSFAQNAFFEQKKIIIIINSQIILLFFLN